jgi:hypothetical protein
MEKIKTNPDNKLILDEITELIDDMQIEEWYIYRYYIEKEANLRDIYELMDRLSKK